MSVKQKYDVGRLRDYSSLFSRSEAARWLIGDFSSLNGKIRRYDPLQINGKTSYLSYLKNVYSILENYYPNQYVYKNELIRKWLITEIGLKDSVIFNEFRIGNAVADLTMFNGISRVFEIKSPLDKDGRLDNQLTQYKKIFNEIYVVVPDVRAESIMKRDSSVGVIALNHKNQTFTKLRSPAYHHNLEVDCLMSVLHTREYLQIVKEYYGELPPMNDFNKFEISKGLIRQIPCDILNNLFIEMVKMRSINNEFSLKNAQFNQLCLALNYSSLQRKKLLSNLSTMIA